MKTKKEAKSKVIPKNISKAGARAKSRAKIDSMSCLEARQLALAAQGIGVLAPEFGTGLKGTLKAIEHLSYVQIDTISVVERAHHHILQTRVPSYSPSFLNTLVKDEKKVFEYWSHAASYLPMSEFRFSLLRKRRFCEGLSHWHNPTAEHKRWRKIILNRIRVEGPLQSKDFERPENAKQGWFERTPAKQMLEQLFMEGELMISERRGFQKVFDLTERVLPSNVNTKFPTQAEMALYLIQTALRSHGLVTINEICYGRSVQLKTFVKEILMKLVDQGEVSELTVEGSPENYFVQKIEFARNLKKFRISSQLQDSVANNRVYLLSPFDGLVIQRRRLKNLFDFDYLIECYVPEPKRKYGYFSLPILYGFELVGLVDLKAHRDIQTLAVNRAFVKANLLKDDHFQHSFQESLKSFAKFNACERVLSSKKFEKFNEV